MLKIQMLEQIVTSESAKSEKQEQNKQINKELKNGKESDNKESSSSGQYSTPWIISRNKYVERRKNDDSINLSASSEKLHGASTRDLFELLERVQCSRLDDQRCVLPAYFSQTAIRMASKTSVKKSNNSVSSSPEIVCRTNNNNNDHCSDNQNCFLHSGFVETISDNSSLNSIDLDPIEQADRTTNYMVDSDTGLESMSSKGALTKTCSQCMEEGQNAISSSKMQILSPQIDNLRQEIIQLKCEKLDILRQNVNCQRDLKRLRERELLLQNNLEEASREILYLRDLLKEYNYDEKEFQK